MTLTPDQNGQTLLRKHVLRLFGHLHEQKKDRYRAQRHFDPENRLLHYDNSFASGYNGDGLRAWKDSGSERRYFLYDGIQPVCELLFNDSEMVLAATNTFGPAGLLSRKEVAVRDIWYTFDSEGNVAQRLDEQGDLFSTDLYDAWGNLRAGGDQTDPFGYKAISGYYTDHETGLILCTFRYYDPTCGRWLTRDPIGFVGGINLYEYCGNEPIDYTDELGLWMEEGVYSIAEDLGRNLMDASSMALSSDDEERSKANAIYMMVFGKTVDQMIAEQRQQRDQRRLESLNQISGTQDSLNLKDGSIVIYNHQSGKVFIQYPDGTVSQYPYGPVPYSPNISPVDKHIPAMDKK